MKKTSIFCELILFVFVFLVNPGVSPGQSTAELTKKLEQLNAYPDLVVVNGKIATMDAQNTQVQALAIKNHRIISRGSNDEIRFLAGPKTIILDAKGRVVLPGMVDTHTHPQSYTAQHWLGAEGEFTSKKYNDPQMKIVLAKGNDKTEVLRSLERVVRQRAGELGPGKWILVQLFGKNSVSESREITWQMVGGAGLTATISKDFLDALAPNNPLVVSASERTGGSAINSKAQVLLKSLLGIERLGAFTSGGTRLVFDILLRGRTEDQMDLLKRELEQCMAGQGITTYSTSSYGSPTVIKIINKLIERDQMPVRHAFWLDAGEHNSVGDIRGFGNDYLWNAGVGLEGYDGQMICTTARPTGKVDTSGFQTGSAGLDGPRPNCEDAKIDYEKVDGYTTIRSAMQAGLRPGFMHHYSDGSFDATFNMFEQEIAKGTITLEQIRALRLTTEHTPLIRPDSIPKIAYYNVRPSFTAYMAGGDMKGGAFIKAYGEKFMPWLQPMKSVVAAGTHPAFGSDAHFGRNIPVEWQDMGFPREWDGNVWAYYQFFLDRKMPDGITYNANEATDRVSVMKAATIWGAESLLNEKNIGSLEVGKLADFIVIDKDFFSVPVNQVGTIKTLLTVVGGKTIYKDPSY
jgi:predicted amidohydrolase YtcJ